MQSFYVYAYLRSKDSLTSKSGTPYYIGKGTGNRAYVKHYAPLPKDKSNITFIKQNLTEQQAHDLEIELIAKYGRKELGTGILHNRTNGGEGSSGAIRSLETRTKIAKAHTGKKRKPVSEETKQRMRIAQQGNNKGLLRSEETRKRMSKAQQGRVVSPSTTEKWRKAMELRRLSGIKDTRVIKQVTCPHCNKLGGGGNMTRYHFDNCKKKYA